VNQQTLYQTRFHAWQAFSREVSARAERTSQMILDRGRDLGEQIGLGREYAFHLAHNALCGDGWKEYRHPKRRAALRRILWLQEQSWKPGEIAQRVIARAWDQLNSEGWQ
jgi:hypothetical protein